MVESLLLGGRAGSARGGFVPRGSTSVAGDIAGGGPELIRLQASNHERPRIPSADVFTLNLFLETPSMDGVLGAVFEAVGVRDDQPAGTRKVPCIVDSFADVCDMYTYRGACDFIQRLASPDNPVQLSPLVVLFQPDEFSLKKIRELEDTADVVAHFVPDEGTSVDFPFSGRMDVIRRAKRTGKVSCERARFIVKNDAVMEIIKDEAVAKTVKADVKAKSVSSGLEYSEAPIKAVDKPKIFLQPDDVELRDYDEEDPDDDLDL